MSKVWLVTGSSRGLGRSIVGAVLKAGDRVVATARRPQTLSDLADRHGSQMLAVTLDVTDPEQARGADRAGVETFGRLDVVVNNAGYGNLWSAAVGSATIYHPAVLVAVSPCGGGYALSGCGHDPSAGCPWAGCGTAGMAGGVRARWNHRIAVRFARLRGVHFARLFVMPDEGDGAVSLVYMADADGPLRRHLSELAGAGVGLDRRSGTASATRRLARVVPGEAGCAGIWFGRARSM